MRKEITYVLMLIQKQFVYYKKVMEDGQME